MFTNSLSKLKDLRALLAWKRLVSLAEFRKKVSCCPLPFMSTKPPFDAHTRPGQILTDMPYAIYAEGFWRASSHTASIYDCVEGLATTSTCVGGRARSSGDRRYSTSYCAERHSGALCQAH